MSIARKAVAAAIVALGIGTTNAYAEFDFDGPASDGSIRAVRPGDAPATAAVRPGDAPTAAVMEPRDLAQTESVRPGANVYTEDVLRPGERQMEAISPSDSPALPAIRPGESRTQDIYNPRHYGVAADVAAAEWVVTEGPAAEGSVRQPYRFGAFPTGEQKSPP